MKITEKSIPSTKKDWGKNPKVDASLSWVAATTEKASVVRGKWERKKGLVGEVRKVGQDRVSQGFVNQGI